MFLKAFLASVFCFTFHTSARADISSLKLCYENREQPPYYLGDSVIVPSQKQGIYIEILTKVAAQLEIELSLVRRPWNRCLRLLELNEIDGVLGASFLEERKAIGHYPFKAGIIDQNARLAKKSYSLYVLKNHRFVWTGDLSQIKGKSIGIPLGYAIGTKLNRVGVKVSEQPHTELLLEMLKHRRIEVIATLAEVGDFLIQKDPLRYKDIIKLSPNLQAKAYYLLFSHQYYDVNRDIAEAIWNLIPVYRPEIDTKYGIVD
ncbi:substrate-binding periplasmic protein [Kiloniella spongiae]|uniref:substrate-binding periplasmic protein n=1 Tax=Kiloniella spongiae TaxID=1489064 RepID=UPI00138E48A6|nr:transporter substrate-binding domain-containing protein [Kiloniella spongiae]